MDESPTLKGALLFLGMLFLLGWIAHVMSSPPPPSAEDYANAADAEHQAQIDYGDWRDQQDRAAEDRAWQASARDRQQAETQQQIDDLNRRVDQLQSPNLGLGALP